MNCQNTRTPLSRRSMWWRTALAGLFLTMLMPTMKAQVAYAEGWNVAGLAGWTNETGFGAQFGGATACDGLGAVRHNLWGGATTWNFRSPLLGTSVGGLTTASFNYKVAVWSANTAGQANPWGSILVQWSNSTAGPWTTVGTIDQTNHIVSGTCAPRSYNFTPTAGPLYMRLAATWIGTIGADCYVNYDAFTVSEVTGPCSGTPNPGNTLASASTVCSGVNFTLSLQNSTSGSGVTYQWESADDAAFTVNLASLGTAPTQVTNQTSDKYYRCIVTCPGALPPSGTSNPVLVTTTSGAALCGTYCAANYGVGKTDGDLISNVVISGTTLANNSGTAPVNPAYTFFFGAPNYTASMQAGSSYNVTVTIGSFSNQGVAVWIDYNDDGVFTTPGERVGFTPGTITTAFGSGTFPISLACNPPLGAHRMRVRLNYAMAGGSIDPCATYTWGECEDYVVTITTADPCPAPSLLNVSAVTANSATLGWTTGCAETMWDVHFQAAGGGAPGIPSNPGLTSTSLNVTGLVPGDYEFYVRAVCGGVAGNSVWSGPFIFTILANDVCASALPLTVGAFGSCPGAATTGTTVGANGGELPLPTCLITGLVDVYYTFNSGSNTSIIWNIAYGTMSAVGVQVLTACGGTEVYCLGDQLTGTLTVAPNTDYIFRVLTLTTTTGTFNICLQGAPAPACAANPTPADNGTACSTSAVTLSWPAVLYASSYDVILNGNTVSTGQTGTTYNAGILGAGAHTWSVIPSGSGGTATGCPTWSFTTNLLGCYCASGATTTADEEIYSVTVNAVTNGSAANCTIVAPGSGSLLNQYANYFPLGPIFSIQQGVQSSFSIEENECDGATFFSFGTAIWIDYDQNGTFDDNTEKVFVEAATAVGPRNVVGNFTAPLSSTLGVTAMRVIVAEGFAGASLTSCLSYGFGETEDYLVTITAPPLPASASASILGDCPNNTFDIDVNISSFGDGGSATIEYSVDNGPVQTMAGNLGSNILDNGGLGFPGLSVVSITVTNGTASELEMGNFFTNCPVLISCGSTTTVTHCYQNNDPRTFIFESNNVNETVTVTFVSGTMDPNDVIRAYDGTDNSGAPIASLTGTFANLANVTGTSGSYQMFIEIDSDGSNSCFDTQQSTWVFEVECTAGCVDPDGSVSVDPNCSMITVDVLFEGDGLTTTLSYSVNAGAFTDIPGLTAGASEEIGPFAPGDVVQIYLLHETDGACNKNLGSFTIPAQPNPISLIAVASPANICPGGNSQLNVIAGTTTAYTVLPATFGLRSGTALGSFPGDDGVSAAVTLPFSFKFFGNTYTTLQVCNNGFIGFGGGMFSQYSAPIPQAGNPSNFIAAVKADLNVQAGGMTWFVNGTAPSRVWVAAWNSVPFWPATGSTTFQIHLFEADNHIEVHVANVTGSAAAKALGIEDAAGTVGYSPAGRNNVNWSVTTPEAWGFYPSGGGPYTYLWSPAANLNDATLANPLASAIASTTVYNVLVTGLCEYNASVTVNVATPIASVSITPPTASMCSGNPVTLTANPVGGLAPYTYAWTDPNSNPAGTSVSQSAAIAGTWTVLVTDACGTQSSGTSNVSVNPTPVATASQSAPVCEGGTLTLTAGSDQPGSTFLWSGPAPVGGSTSQIVTVPGLSAANNGTYSVVASAAGCSSIAASTTVSVNPNPTMGPVTATPPTICSGTNSQLNSSASLPTSAYCVPGYSFGCSFPDIINNVTFQAINNSTACSNLNGTAYSYYSALTANVVAGSSYGLSVTTSGDVEGVAAWIDYDRDGVFETSELLVSGYLGTNPATYTASVNIPLTAFNGTTRMRVRCTYSQNPIVLLNPPCTGVTYGETEDYNVTITGGTEQLTYSWSPATFLSATNIPNPMANAVTATTAYTVTATSGAGCTATGNATVSMDVTDTDGDGVINCVDNCPNLFGQIGDACDDGNPNTTLDQIGLDCVCAGSTCTTDLTLEFQMDGVSTETWELRQQGTGMLVQSGSVFIPGPGTITATTCLPDGCFYLRVIDDSGDGITGGGYILKRTSGGRIIDNSNNFSSGAVSAIANNEGFCLPLGSNRLITTSCDKLDWTTGQYIVTNEDPAVSAIWTTYPGGSTQRATSGYEFWFFNPNGGYSFRRFRSHAQADGFSNVGATRACHAKINNWSGNQLQENVLYNVRIRNRVIGVNGEWGVACRMTINSLRAQCPLTQLLNISGNPNYSCNSTRNWGTGNWVHANPVNRILNGVSTPANRYQFRFRIPAENFSYTRNSQVGTQNYKVHLNWGGGNQLQAGKTYMVDVRASFDQGATWCTDYIAPALVDPWGPVCSLTITSALTGGNQNILMEDETTPLAQLALYPNPNRGDQVLLSLDQVEEGVNTVSVDIVDAFGKHVSTRTIPVQDGFVNTMLELNGELAAGMYTVNITAGSMMYTERLVIQP